MSDSNTAQDQVVYELLTLGFTEEKARAMDERLASIVTDLGMTPSQLAKP